MIGRLILPTQNLVQMVIRTIHLELIFLHLVTVTVGHLLAQSIFGEEFDTCSSSLEDDVISSDVDNGSIEKIWYLERKRKEVIQA